MVPVTIVVVLVVSLAAFLGFWVLIEGETSNPPVMDREEAERRAIEQGGRGTTAQHTGRETRDSQPDERDDAGEGWD